MNSPERLNAFLRFIVKMLKGKLFGEKPFTKNSQTDPTYIITGNPDFDTEKEKVMSQIPSFSNGGPPNVPHKFMYFLDHLLLKNGQLCNGNILTII